MNNNSDIRVVHTKYVVNKIEDDWDEQARFFSEIGEYTTQQAAQQYEEANLSNALITRELAGYGLIIVDSETPAKNQIPEDKMRGLTEEEIDFIRKLEKRILASTFENGERIAEIFGKPKTTSPYEQYYGFVDPNSRFVDGKDILIVFDLSTGEATTSTQLRFLEKEMKMDSQIEARRSQPYTATEIAEAINPR